MSDTIDVRPDEQFDLTSLADYLHGQLPGSESPLAVRQFGGGMANLTYLLDYGDQQYVLRRPPLGPVAAGAHDMSREFQALSKLWRAFPPAPRAYLHCTDTSVIGAAFFVMERREGLVVRGRLPAEYRAAPEAGRKLSEALVDTLADFHAVDYKHIGLDNLGRPEGFIARQITGWYKRWEAAKHKDLPAMEQVYTWLCDYKPPAGPPTLVHNDYKLDNAMFASDDPGRLVAIFDWDMCTLGDPLSDLGALLTYWSEPSDPPYLKMVTGLMMPVGQTDFLSRDELIARYAARSGRDLSQVHFYHALGLFRLVVIMAQIYIRYLRGQTQDQRFEALGDLIPLIAQAAQEKAGG